ncbi:MAG TPA: hypothetical protein VFC47_00495 [Caulobacteraceae bacterium]|nr:hypothetical protein [Caulobacteraceae bacterium]
MSTAQIGASGVLLIQYRLLKLGIDSAQMTTDDGIDLVVYAWGRKKAVTVQVKTCHCPKPAGGKGAPALDWWLRSDSPAEVVGLVDLATDRAWMFRHEEFQEKAQQKPEGRLHLYFYTDAATKSRADCHVNDFKRFLLENRINDLFGLPEISNRVTTSRRARLTAGPSGSKP